MATSGSTSYNPSRDTIINAALRLVGAYATGSSPRSVQVKEASEALNLMLKAWRTDHGLWLREFHTLFLVPGQTSYNLPGAHAASSVTESALTTAGVATDTTLYADTTGMTAADIVGIELDDATVQWTTVATVPDATYFTVDDQLTGDAATGNAIYYYPTSSATQRPTRVFNASRVTTGGYEVPLNPMSRSDYMALTNKTVEGPVVSYYLDAQRSTAKLYLWPTGENETDTIVIDVDRQIEDMLNEGNTYDVPQEWVECIKYGLAWRLAGEYGLNASDRADLRAEYNILKEQIKSDNIDYASVQFEADFSGR